MVREERALAFQEVEEIKDLLELGRDIRVVASEVDVVELDVDNVLNAVGEFAGFLLAATPG
jgi:hypothetical protein